MSLNIRDEKSGLLIGVLFVCVCGGGGGVQKACIIAYVLNGRPLYP